MRVRFCRRGVLAGCGKSKSGQGDELGCGTIFKITPGGTFTNLYSFLSFSVGANPETLVQATDGSFYGTMGAGGYDGAGTIFSLSVGLGPFVKTLPHSGKVGAPIKILGTNLTGTTSVSFNGTAAVFTVFSATEIKTTVPAAATTGKIQVTTPASTLFSGAAFLVRP